MRGMCLFSRRQMDRRTNRMTQALSSVGPELPGCSKVAVSSEAGSWPRFRRDGKELFYLAANGKLMT